MSKLLFLGLLGVVVYLVLRGLRGRERGAAAPPPAAQQMVTCAQCGVNLPENESLSSGTLHYCCDQHRELGPGPLARKR